ncbi:MAG: hypothetical protein AAFO86_09335, partial [Pseudomonadota bacterium]
MTLPAAFAETGFFATRAGDTPITRFQVLGERSSGTNFVKRLLGRNTDLTPSEALGWKHGPPHMMAVPRDMAVICMVRRADGWARSMYQKPWHTTPEMQALPFSRFIRAPWTTIIDRPRYFRGLMAEGSVGAPLQQDRDPATGLPFDNIFAMRRSKLASLLTLPARGCTCVMLRMEDVQSDPQGTLAQMSAVLGVAVGAPYRPVVKRLGSKFKPSVTGRPDLPESWDDADLAFLRASVDPDQE